MKFTLTIDMDNAAYQGSRSQLRDNLRDVAYRVTLDEARNDSGTVRDFNGNTTGHWEITP